MKAVHRILNPATPDLTAQGVCALGIMTKAPRAGHVKTRLTPPLTPDEAAQLNICFLRDTAAAIAICCSGGPAPPNSSGARRAPLQKPGENAQGVAVYTPVGAETAYIDILPHDFQLVPQRGDLFGERLGHAAEDLFRIGFASVCLIDSDSPTVSSAFYSEAVSELAKPGDRVVLGPTDDGGYYLIGLKKDHRRLFEGIDWSTERVLDQTMQVAAELGVPVHQLPMGYDVDDRATLRRLCDELLGEKRRSSIDLAPATGKFLVDIIKSEGCDRIWPDEF